MGRDGVGFTGAELPQLSKLIKALKAVANPTKSNIKELIYYDSIISEIRVYVNNRLELKSPCL